MLCADQKNYLCKILKKFYMLDAKPNNLTIGANHKLERKYSDDESIFYNIHGCKSCWLPGVHYNVHRASLNLYY